MTLFAALQEVYVDAMNSSFNKHSIYILKEGITVPLYFLTIGRHASESHLFASSSLLRLSHTYIE